jgi:hypothetical protein
MSTIATETMTGAAPPATQNRWARSEARWKDVIRPYTKEEVERLRGTVKIEYTLARLGAERLWKLLQQEDYVPTLGALTGNQAVQQVHAGLKAIYLSGWQVAADANLAGQMYPDQSLYPANSVPAVVRRINNALLRADQVRHLEGKNHFHWLAPIVDDRLARVYGIGAIPFIRRLESILKQWSYYQMQRFFMKVGVVGVGHVGGNAALNMALRISCRETVLIDVDRQLAVSQALDISQASTLVSGPKVRAGDYHDLVGADIVVLAPGINEKAGGADRPGDKEGRHRLLDSSEDSDL